jgi:hypothetical protein
MTALVVESLRLNHLTGIVMARETTKHIRSKMEKSVIGRATSPDFASPTFQPTEVTKSIRRNAATEHAAMRRQWLLKIVLRIEHIRRLTLNAEPPPTRDVNRDSGTDSANGGWLRRLVRPLVV